jgi:hypothetical protein
MRLRLEDRSDRDHRHQAPRGSTCGKPAARRARSRQRSVKSRIASSAFYGRRRAGFAVR